MATINKKIIGGIGTAGGISGLITGIVSLIPEKEWDIEEKRILFTPKIKKVGHSTVKHDWNKPVKNTLPWLLLKCQNRCGWNGTATELNLKHNNNKVFDFEIKSVDPNPLPVFLFDYSNLTPPKLNQMIIEI